MNYIEIGLPHSEFVPTKKQFTPRRPVPLSGLGKKYLGLEELSKTEIDTLVNRLAQPKQWQKDGRSGRADKEEKKRFTGKKKMSNSDMQSMIDRLTKGKSSRTPESNRVQSKEEENFRGVTRSYAWQGKIPRFQKQDPQQINIERLHAHSLQRQDSHHINIERYQTFSAYR